MSIDLHLARRLVGWGLVLLALAPFLLSLQPPTDHPDLYSVTGRVTLSGQPISNLYICLDSDGGHSALGALGEDGSFRLVNFQYAADGALAGRYHVHLGSYGSEPGFLAKYGNSRTSGLEIDVASDWNHVDIDLH